MNRASTFFVLCLLCPDAAAFKFLANFKAASLIPRPGAMLKRRQAAKTFGDKKLAVITGASSGLGLETAAELLRTGEYHVFGAVRDIEKMRSVAKDQDFSLNDFTPLELELGSFASVRAFCKDLEKAKLNKPIDRLICNAATYEAGDTPAWSVDGHERTLQVNFLSHFLLVSLLLPGMAKAAEPRVVVVGGAQAREGVGVYPRADLSTLDGLKAGAANPIAMLDGFQYHGGKAYKDSKLCLTMLAHMLHERYYKQTGVSFACMYPGQVTDSALFRGRPPLDSSSPLPAFVHSLASLELATLRTLGRGTNLHADGLTRETSTVATAAAGARLFQAVYDGRCAKSGVSWSWREGQAARDASEAAAQEVGAEGVTRAHAGWDAVYEAEAAEELLDMELSHDLWKHATALTAANWPPAYQPRSPCPTLVVVGAITKAMNAKEEAKRTLAGIEAPAEAEADGSARVAAKVGATLLGSTGMALDVVAGHTIGRAAKLAQDRLLGGMVNEALEGSYQETLDANVARAEAAAAAAAARRSAEGVTSGGALEERIAEVLSDGGMKVPSVGEEQEV